MIKDEFKLSKLNITLIIVDIILVIVVIASAVRLIVSLNDSNDTIPDLRTTAGKTSTKEADLTVTTTTEAVTITTKKQGNQNSPYYDLVVNSLLTDEIYTKNTGLTNKEQEQIIEGCFNVLRAIYDYADNDLINIEYLLEHVKSGEADSITANDHKYGMIYNSNELFKRLFYAPGGISFTNYKYKGIPILKESNGNYYKIEKLGDTSSFIVDRYAIEYPMSGSIIYGKVTYYDSNYKELGYASPNYKSAKISLRYDTENKVWKILSFEFPGLEV
jgi:hypothetical protein